MTESSFSARSIRYAILLVASITTAACATFQREPAARPVSMLQSSARGFDSAGSRIVLPLTAGQAGGRTAWFVLLETSDADEARRLGVLHAPRLAELRGTAVVQRGRWAADRLEVDAGVDFTPERRVTPGAPEAFPPAGATPGAVGQDGYSPFVEFPDGTVRNMPLVADARLQADRVLLIDREQRWVAMRVTRGYASGRTLWYISTEASDPMVAAIEGATFAPRLAAIPSGMRGSDLVAFVNGPSRAEDAVERHGMRSALSGEGDPLNTLAALPGDTLYAPLWTVHMAMWTPRAVREGRREKLLSLADVRSRIADGLATGMAPDGSLVSAGALVSCPVVAMR